MPVNDGLSLETEYQEYTSIYYYLGGLHILYGYIELYNLS